MNKLPVVLLALAIWSWQSIGVCYATGAGAPSLEFKSQRLTKAVDLVGLPPYNGKKVQFVIGTLCPSVKGGASVTEQFSVSEKPQDVLDWYKNQFTSNQCQMMGAMSDPKSITAVKANNVCQVLVLPATKKGSNSGQRLTGSIHGLRFSDERFSRSNSIACTCSGDQTTVGN